MNRNLYAVVLAGGGGERLWPLSRKSMPKQCLKIAGAKSLIQAAVERVAPIVAPENVFISTNRELQQLIQADLHYVKDKNYIVEPLAKGTAACIGLAAMKIAALDSNAMLLVISSDIWVRDARALRDALLKAAAIAEKENKVVTIGIAPDSAATEYGYIETGERLADGAFAVTRFVEKPSRRKAEQFIASRKYLWNSGIFACRAAVLLRAIEQHMPLLYGGLQRIKERNFDEKVAAKEFKGFENISIDHAIMEKAKNIAVVKGEFEWADIGSWAVLEKLLGEDGQGNSISGTCIAIDSKNNVVKSDKQLIALLGVNDLAVVSMNGAVLVCKKQQAQRVRELVKKLEKSEELRKFIE